jgi:hypothetical protein
LRQRRQQQQQQQRHVAVKFDVGHGGPHQDCGGGHVCVTVKQTAHICCQWSANLTTVILEPRASDFVTNITTATLSQTVAFSERGCSLIKTVHAQKVEQQHLFGRSSSTVSRVEKQRGFCFLFLL